MMYCNALPTRLHKTFDRSVNLINRLKIKKRSVKHTHTDKYKISERTRHMHAQPCRKYVSSS